MNTNLTLTHHLLKTTIIVVLLVMVLGCKPEPQPSQTLTQETTKIEAPDYYHLRPELEKMYGFTQAVRVGNLVKIGGVISMDEKGNPLAAEDYLQQMKNCYASIEKVLAHYGITFDHVILENIYTTSMAELQQNASYRHEIYKNHFPTGSWIGIKELGLPEMKIEIEIEAIIPD